MFEKSREELCKLCKETLQDNKTGKYSHAKVIAMLGFVAATFFIWKLIVINQLTLDMFIVYLVYTTSTQTLNKLIDSRNMNNILKQEVKEDPRKADKVEEE